MGGRLMGWRPRRSGGCGADDVGLSQARIAMIVEMFSWRVDDILRMKNCRLRRGRRDSACTANALQEVFYLRAFLATCFVLPSFCLELPKQFCLEFQAFFLL